MWNFERVETKFEDIPVGQYRLVIETVEKQVSQAGRDMLKLTFKVSGQARKLYHYIVFLDDRPEITNRNLTQLFDSFGIEDNSFNLNSWIGKAGACMIKHDEEERAKVQYFLNKKQQEKLPPWQEVTADASKAPKQAMTEVEVDDEDLPF